MQNPSVMYLIINLQSAQARRERMQAQVAQMGLSVHWVQAVSGQELTPEQRACYDDARMKTYRNYTLMPNEIACVLSHRKALLTFLQSSAEYGVILEDDADLKPNFNEGIRELTEHLSGWDVAKLYSGKGFRTISLLRSTAGAAVRPIYHRKFGAVTVGYMYTRHAARTLYEALASFWLPADTQIYQIVLEKRLCIIGVSPDICCQAGLASTINTDASRPRGKMQRRNFSQYVRHRLMAYGNMVRKFIVLLKVKARLRRRA